jgi:hypothetical protein
MDILNRGLQTTDGKLYFLNLSTRDRLEVQFVPYEISISRSADWGKIAVIGRNIPQYQHLGGETRLNLMLDFYADEESRSSVIRKCRWMESLTANDGGKKPAPKVALVFGDLYKDQQWVVEDVDYKLSGFDKTRGLLPQQAYVNVRLNLDSETNPSWADILTSYDEGLSDGLSPINLGIPRADDSQVYFEPSNNNDFRTILDRALTRMRLSGTF